MNKNFKFIGFSILVGVIVYSTAMIVIRLQMTNMAYEFEEMKGYERSMKEEQRRLRARLAKELSPENIKVEGFSEPRPEQVVVIP